jgi:hypothetical protein
MVYLNVIQRESKAVIHKSYVEVSLVNIRVDPTATPISVRLSLE